MKKSLEDIPFKYKGEDVKAFCYIYKDKDKTNRCFLTNGNLIIIVNSREYTYPLEFLRKITIEHKLAMVPLIAGGIVVPFSLIAIFNNLYDPWLLIYLFVSGALIFYLGWKGYIVLNLSLQKEVEENLKLKTVTEPLRAFISFTNEYIKMEKQGHKNGLFIYHLVEKGEWQKKIKDGLYSPDSLKAEGFIHCSQKNQVKDTFARFFKNSDNIRVLTIDPFKVKPEIKYEGAKDSEGLFPHIYGALNIEAVINEEDIFSFLERLAFSS